jgi:hypothetical protein
VARDRVLGRKKKDRAFDAYNDGNDCFVDRSYRICCTKDTHQNRRFMHRSAVFVVHTMCDAQKEAAHIARL